jgi:hypothetical protein
VRSRAHAVRGEGDPDHNWGQSRINWNTVKFPVNLTLRNWGGGRVRSRAHAVRGEGDPRLGNLGGALQTGRQGGQARCRVQGLATDVRMQQGRCMRLRDDSEGRPVCRANTWCLAAPGDEVHLGSHIAHRDDALTDRRDRRRDGGGARRAGPQQGRQNLPNREADAAVKIITGNVRG